jgi:hypothetical protein
MIKCKYLKWKGKFYLKLIGLISILGFISACASTKNKHSNTNNNKDSTIVMKDTTIIIKDTTIINYNEMPMKYGVIPNYYKEIDIIPNK